MILQKFLYNKIMFIRVIYYDNIIQYLHNIMY